MELDDGTPKVEFANGTFLAFFSWRRNARNWNDSPLTRRLYEELRTAGTPLVYPQHILVRDAELSAVREKTLAVLRDMGYTPTILRDDPQPKGNTVAGQCQWVPRPPRRPHRPRRRW